jgi:hypothetical protein
MWSTPTAALPFQSPCAFLGAGDEEFAACLVWVDHTSLVLECVIVGTIDTILCVGVNFKATFRNGVAAVETLGHGVMISGCS